MDSNASADLELMDKDSLLCRLRQVMADLDPLAEQRKRIEFLLQRNMERDGATEFFGRNGKAVLETKLSYDPDMLDGLYELVGPQEHADAGVVIPAHTVDVDREWRMTETRERKLGKRGAGVANMIALTRTESRGKLKVTTNRSNS